MKVWCIYTKKYYSAIKKNETMKFTYKWSLKKYHFELVNLDPEGQRTSSTYIRVTQQQGKIAITRHQMLMTKSSNYRNRLIIQGLDSDVSQTPKNNR